MILVALLTTSSDTVTFSIPVSFSACTYFCLLVFTVILQALFFFRRNGIIFLPSHTCYCSLMHSRLLTSARYTKERTMFEMYLVNTSIKLNNFQVFFPLSESVYGQHLNIVFQNFKLTTCELLLLTINPIQFS